MTRRPNTLEKAPPGAVRPASFADAEVVARVQSGETVAYTTLVVKYQDRIFNTCWRICGNLEDARDLTQDAFVKALEGIAAFRQDSGFYTWLFRVAVNLSLSHRRKAKTRHAVSLSQTPAADGTQAEQLAKRIADARGEEPGGAMGAAELQGKMAAALSALDDDHRAVVVLRDIEGFDYAEIGEVLGIPPGTVKSRLHRARMELRAAIAPWMDKHA